jgi:arylsulfatase A-like enzyme
MNPFFSLRAKPGFLPRYLQFPFLFAALLFCAIPIRAAAPKLNFVFILADDFGWKDLGCYGSTFYKTPNIDRLAQHGMKFTDFYAACPVCSPTRASILTGKYPARLNLTDWIPGMKDKPEHKLLRPEFLHQLPLEETTIAEALKPLGYVSASIGKWHLGGDGFGPEQQGFDLNVGGTAAGHPATYFFPFHTKGDALPNLSEGKPNEYLTDRLTDEALKFIEENRAKPFFLYLSHFAVHIPLMAKPELIAKYSETTKDDGAQTNTIYAAMIESLDDSVGRILQKLDELKLTENTVVIFTSDNGGLAMNQGGKGIPTSNLPLRDGKGF